MKILHTSLFCIFLIITSNAKASLATDASLLIGPQNYIMYCSDIQISGDCMDIALAPNTNYFAIDTDGNGIHEEHERVAIEAGQDGGITLGTPQGIGDIDSSWIINDIIGHHTQAGTLTIASDDGNGNILLDMSGWGINWNGGDIDVGTSSASISCGLDCSNGDTFVLDYNAIIPCGGGCIEYQLHLTGTISSVPVPATIWLFSSGIITLLGFARVRYSHNTII